MDAAQDRIIEAVVRADHILAFVRRAIRATAGPKTELTDDIAARVMTNGSVRIVKPWSSSSR